MDQAYMYPNSGEHTNCPTFETTAVIENATPVELAGTWKLRKDSSGARIPKPRAKSKTAGSDIS